MKSSRSNLWASLLIGALILGSFAVPFLKVIGDSSGCSYCKQEEEHWLEIVEFISPLPAFTGEYPNTTLTFEVYITGSPDIGTVIVTFNLTGLEIEVLNEASVTLTEGEGIVNFTWTPPVEGDYVYNISAINETTGAEAWTGEIPLIVKNVEGLDVMWTLVEMPAITDEYEYANVTHEILVDVLNTGNVPLADVYVNCSIYNATVGWNYSLPVQTLSEVPVEGACVSFIWTPDFEAEWAINVTVNTTTLIASFNQTVIIKDVWLLQIETFWLTGYLPYYYSEVYTKMPQKVMVAISNLGNKELNNIRVAAIAENTTLLIEDLLPEVTPEPLLPGEVNDTIALNWTPPEECIYTITVWANATNVPDVTMSMEFEIKNITDIGVYYVSEVFAPPGEGTTPPGDYPEGTEVTINVTFINFGNVPLNPTMIVKIYNAETWVEIDSYQSPVPFELLPFNVTGDIDWQVFTIPSTVMDFEPLGLGNWSVNTTTDVPIEEDESPEDNEASVWYNIYKLPVNGTIEGTVSYPLETNLEGFEIEVLKEDVFIQRGYTDATGAFSISVEEGTNYTLRVSDPLIDPTYGPYYYGPGDIGGDGYNISVVAEQATTPTEYPPLAIELTPNFEKWNQFIVQDNLVDGFVIDLPLEITFVEEMNSTTITPSTFGLYKADDLTTPISAEITTVDNITFVYTPTAPLEEGVTYVFVITPGVKNATDAELVARNIYKQFTTKVTEYGWVYGIVTDADTDELLADVAIFVDDTQMAVTNETGAYNISLVAEAGGTTYTIAVEKSGYYPESTVVTVYPNQGTEQNFALAIVKYGNITGKVTEAETRKPLENVTITVTPVDIYGAEFEAVTYKTDWNGTYLTDDIPVGIWNVSASLEGYITAYQEVEVIEANTTVANFTLEKVPPPITTIPEAGAVDVDYEVLREIVAIFNRDIFNISNINGTTINNETFLLNDGAILPAEITWDNVTGEAKFILAEPLQPSTTYTVRLTTGIKYYDNTSVLTEDYVWSFTTKAPPKVTVVDVAPADGAVDVALDEPIKIVFSESMNISSVEADFTITPAVADLNFTWEALNTTVTITHADFEPNTTYTCMLTEASMNLDNTKSLEPYQWSFTTVPEVVPPVVKPTIVVTVKDKETGDVIVGATVKLTGPVTDEKPTGADGKVTFTELALGTYTVTASAKGYKSASTTVEVTENKTYEITIELEKKPKPPKPPEVNWMLIGGGIIAIIIIIIIVAVAMRAKKPAPPPEVPPAPPPEEVKVVGEFECPNCHTVVSHDVEACPECNEEFEPDQYKCPSCGADVTVEDASCPECGESFEITEEVVEEEGAAEEEVEVEEEEEERPVSEEEEVETEEEKKEE